MAQNQYCCTRMLLLLPLFVPGSYVHESCDTRIAAVHVRYMSRVPGAATRTNHGQICIMLDENDLC